jgi:lipopolysaccharide/colanic/teichoic acid biosynthesis glycosyltransferase
MKRSLDVAVALLALALLWPLMLAAAVLIRLTLGRPVLFIQERPGFKGKIFRMFKFRTMSEGERPDSERMSRFGRGLRAASIDELPELFNVLRGDMSLIGPRPLLTQYLPRYSPEQARRHDVKPGITGWAQVNGRNAISWEKKFALDVWYVDHQSFWLDLKILAMTMKQMFVREGITADGHATMPEFMGDGHSR